MGILNKVKNRKISTSTAVLGMAAVTFGGILAYSIYSANKMVKDGNAKIKEIGEERLRILREAADKGELKVVYDVKTGQLTEDPRYAAEFALKHGLISESEAEFVGEKMERLESLSAKEIQDMQSLIRNFIETPDVRVSHEAEKIFAVDVVHQDVPDATPADEKWLSEMLSAMTAIKAA